MGKTINFNAPCHNGDTIYYVWTRKKNNKYTFKMKKRVACGFLIEDFRQCVCVKDKSGTDGTIDIPMHCVSTEKDVAKAVYNRLISDERVVNNTDFTKVSSRLKDCGFDSIYGGNSKEVGMLVEW